MGARSYKAAAARTWRHGALQGLHETALRRELVRYATLAPSSHNMQCWKFRLGDQAIVIEPDPSRRCPVVDPDDHHVFVSLGCAAENLVQAALAHGFKGEAIFDSARDALGIALTPTAAARSSLFNAIPQRQCTRAEYDGKPLTGVELRLLEEASSGTSVQLLLLTARTELEGVLEFVVQANTAQLKDSAFISELKSWIRFNTRDAVRSGDRLSAASLGNPSVPAWLGRMALGFLVTPKAENDKVARHVRSSAGVAVFVGGAADKASWIEVGRTYERFALQATALGIRHAHLNQPVEVAPLRSSFANLLGLPGRRPDLVLRFGRGPTLPPSLRRPVEAVLS